MTSLLFVFLCSVFISHPPSSFSTSYNSPLSSFPGFSILHYFCCYFHVSLFFHIHHPLVSAFIFLHLHLLVSSCFVFYITLSHLHPASNSKYVDKLIARVNQTKGTRIVSIFDFSHIHHLHHRSISCQYKSSRQWFN